MNSVISFKIFDSAAQILKMIEVHNFMTIPNLSLVRSLKVKFSTYARKRSLKGSKWKLYHNDYNEYAYESIGHMNFLLNSMICILRSSEVILEVKKGHFGVKNLKYGRMHMICIWIDCKFSSEFIICLLRS